MLSVQIIAHNKMSKTPLVEQHRKQCATKGEELDFLRGMQAYCKRLASKEVLTVVKLLIYR